jgi:acetyl-CoA carboxylase carboxyltransferase component
MTASTSTNSLQGYADNLLKDEAVLAQGGSEAGHVRQAKLGRLNVRERLKLLLDADAPSFELGLWAGWKMYDEWGGLPAAGVVTLIGKVSGQSCMVIANDATVKAGAMFPQSIKKVLRAQKIAAQCRLPILYLVDSSGVFLPLQDEIFPDEDDFGRIFRNNAQLSAAGIPQIAAIMGNCIAGGGYLPVLCDTLLMTKGSGLYLAGPALVKAAIGQVVSSEDLGGANMHASISGTVDFLEENDTTCLERLRHLVSLLPKTISTENHIYEAEFPKERIFDLVDGEGKKAYDMRQLLRVFVDKGSFHEYKEHYGKSLITGYASIAGHNVGIVATQRMTTTSGEGQHQIGGVIYPESADKAARFILDCNQMRLPLIFFQDVMGFMVGLHAEQSGIIRSGAKLVNAISNSIVPKITVIIGNSFGAGHYALCGKAYDPNFIVAWPSARYAVMGADQAADTLMEIQKKGKEVDTATKELIKRRYQEQMDIRYGAARGWVDAIIAPETTRDTLAQLLSYTARMPLAQEPMRMGVFQV